MSIMFNEICINEEMLPKYTRTHTHTHTYIYIYIYIYVCVCVCVCVYVCALNPFGKSLNKFCEYSANLEGHIKINPIIFSSTI